ncbi:MAG: MFS transporter [Deltaproteobacteria bacterium]|nr:MFS transporter [Deltaproteobacteria bacterium]
MTERFDALSLLREPAFVRYQLIRFVSVIAIQMLSVATAWEIYARAGTAESLGYVGLATFAPQILFLPFTGVAADRYDRRVVLGFSHLVIGLSALGFAYLAAHPELGTAPFYAVLFVFGSARAFAGPASQAITPSLVPSELFARAIAISSTTFQVAVVLGPALGGALVAPIRTSGVYFVSAALELSVIALLPFIALRTHVRARRDESRWAQLLSGIRFVKERPALLGAITLDLFAVILGGATALMPIFARDILHVGEWGLGVLRAAPALGALLVALYLGLRPLAGRAGVIMLVCVAIFGACTIVFGLSESFPLSIVALVVMGGADMVSVVVRHVIVQGQTPDEMRGRVAAVNMVFIGASNELGELESGMTAAWLGTVPAVVVGGIGTILVTAFCAVAFPDLRRIDRLEAPR